MNRFISTLQENSVGVFGSLTSWLAVITARQEQAEFWLRCMSYMGAVVVSVVTVFYMVKRGGKRS